MGSLKLEQRQKVESDQERGQEIVEMGEQRIRELEEYFSYYGIEVLDDEDESVMDMVCHESTNISNDTLDDSSFCLQSPGFDDCFNKEEREYISKKHPNIALIDNIHMDNNDVKQLDSSRNFLSLDSTFADAEGEVQNHIDDAEQIEDETQLEIEQLLSSLENIF